jgi:RND family efflux transporter MFP subunit
VRKGDVLIQLSSIPLHAAVERSQSQLLAMEKQEDAAEVQRVLAQTTYTRYTILNQRHSVTPYEFDLIKAQLDAADVQKQVASAQVESAKASMRQSAATSAFITIRAPFSGIITRKYIDAGALASPGVPLLQMEDASEREVDIQVNESSLPELHPGMLVQVQLNNSDTPIEAKVREIVPSGDPVTHTFVVKIDLPTLRGLYSGMTANVLIPAGEQHLITVPKDTIRHRGQLDSVIALDNNSVGRIRYVALGQEHGDTVEVVSGIAPGDRVLAQPSDSFIGHKIERQP